MLHYRDYIKSELWEQRKRRYFSSHPHNCQVCGHPDVDLHHLVYADFGYEKDKNLAALCRVHHEELHQMIKLRQNMFYQSHGAVEEMKENWLRMRKTIEDPVSANISSGRNPGKYIHTIAKHVRRPFRKFF